MKYTTILAAGLIAVSSTAAFAASADTQKFVKMASSSDMFEIQSSKLALSKSKNADVKQLAQQMITDHTKSTAGLKAALAQSKSDAKPAMALETKHADMLKAIKEADADDFDATYLDKQEDAHTEAVSLFEDYADDGDTAAIKQFAAKTLPTLKMHKDHVEKLDDKKMGDNL